MGLDYAIDELHATGWAVLDSTGCLTAPDGRLYPGLQRVQETFRRAGCTLTLKKADLFDCYRAAWTDATGQAAGAVVGQTEDEAAVFALAQLRRTPTPPPAQTPAHTHAPAVAPATTHQSSQTTTVRTIAVETAGVG